MENMGFRVHSQLRAGDLKKITNFPDFVQIFMSQVMPGACKSKQLIDILNWTNQKCKDDRNGRKCDQWAENFGLPFGHG